MFSENKMKNIFILVIISLFSATNCYYNDDYGHVCAPYSDPFCHKFDC
jgi:hypothetical protein